MSAECPCPLCGGGDALHFQRDTRRDYLRCPRCELVFVPPGFYLERAAERAEYDLHQNRVDDPGYRRFLGRLAQPLLAALPEAGDGLEFGCGPGPALAAMLSDAGHNVSLYDSFYAPDQATLARSYDFITATEVVEHLHHPGTELARLWSLLRPGGVLGIMTKLVLDPAAFAHWHYKNDPTHVCFFSAQTWRWWAARRGARLDFVADDALLLRKALI